jgi:UDP-2,3-diacylglucosamine hydrolase
MHKVAVVSDLHMYCRRSQWEDHLEMLYDTLDGSDLFVFNGDTFDFKWTTLESIEETIAEACNFLETFAKRNPDCHVHVNLGNHDHSEEFIEALDALCKRVPNLTWHAYYLRLGNTIFLHGDVANTKMNHRKLQQYRNRWRHHRKQGHLKNRVYDVVFRANAHVAVSRLAFPPRRTLKRVQAYLEDVGHGPSHGVERVFFGHTHVPVRGVKYRGVTYHNGGAPMKGMGFELIKTHC